MAYPDALIYRLDSTGIHETCYTDTEHYRITSDFLADPARSLRELLGDG
jgi:predicted ATPase